LAYDTKKASKIAMSMLAKEGQPGLDLERVVCVSARVRELLIDAGLPIENARIIHGGTDVARFTNGNKRVDLSESAKLLYAGQLVQHKGVHTAIECNG
jgi:glycosyltransferase involved in cell wall biosynthesis